MINIVAKLKEAIKPYGEGLFLATAIVIIGLISFGLGRLSARYDSGALEIDSTPISTNAVEGLASSQNQDASMTADVSGALGAAVEQKIIGNKQSKIYHLESCPGALKMRQENKVFFASISEAQKAGFRAAANCPGLE